MAKQSGLGVRLYAAGYDLSGDANALNNMGYSQTMLDVTSLQDSAMARIAGLSDGTVTVNGWFEKTGDHAAWTSNSGKLPSADQVVVVGFGTALGDACLGMKAKQASYNVTRAPGNAIATVAEYQSTAGQQLDFGVLLTTGPKQTDASATDSTSVDQTAGTSAGAVGYIEAMSIGSGSATVKIQSSTNNTVWSDLITFTAVTGQTSERVAVTGTVNRYVRVISTGTFTNLVFVVGFARL
jgi:hypothetical protein